MINYLKNTSYPKRINVRITTKRKNFLMKVFPFFIATFAPINPPSALQKAIGIAIAQTIFPFKTKRQIEPKLVARLTIFALAEACRKSKPVKIKPIINSQKIVE